jgi:hypothetical protein
MIQIVTSELQERVREITEDPRSAGVRVFERRKADYLRFGKRARPPVVLVPNVLGALRIRDGDDDLKPENVSQSVHEQLAPVVEQAMEVFRQRRPDLDPESPQNW